MSEELAYTRDDVKAVAKQVLEQHMAKLDTDAIAELVETIPFGKELLKDQEGDSFDWFIEDVAEAIQKSTTEGNPA